MNSGNQQNKLNYMQYNMYGISFWSLFGEAPSVMLSFYFFFLLSGAPMVSRARLRMNLNVWHFKELVVLNNSMNSTNCCTDRMIVYTVIYFVVILLKVFPFWNLFDCWSNFRPKKNHVDSFAFFGFSTKNKVQTLSDIQQLDR